MPPALQPKRRARRAASGARRPHCRVPRAGPNGQVPPEIEKLDPKIVEQVRPAFLRPKLASSCCATLKANVQSAAAGGVGAACAWQVCHEILDQSGTVQWEDVAGLDVAKKLLQEVIVWPMTNPQLFTVSQMGRRSWLACTRHAA